MTHLEPIAAVLRVLASSKDGKTQHRLWRETGTAIGNYRTLIKCLKICIEKGWCEERIYDKKKYFVITDKGRRLLHDLI